MATICARQPVEGRRAQASAKFPEPKAIDQAPILRPTKPVSR
jgi:hypothetical protein